MWREALYEGDQEEAEAILGQPLPADKLRPAYLNTKNRRKQR